MKKQTALLVITLLIMNSMHAQKQILTPELLWKLGRVGLENVSPDGKIVVYSVARYTLATNKRETNLFAVMASGEKVMQLTTGENACENVRFRPDGKKMGYLNKGLLYEMNLDGSDSKKLSDQEMGGFEYSPDGKNILYLDDVKYFKDALDIYPDLPLAKAKIIDDLMYRHWKSWDDMKRSNVFYMACENGVVSGKAVNIMEGEPYHAPMKPDGGIEQMCWSPDGKSIVYTSRKLNGKAEALSTNSDIYQYDLAKKTTKNISEGMMGYDLEPSFSPDGRYLAWLSMERAGFEADRTRIFVYDTKDGSRKELTKGYDHEAHHLQWAADSKGIYFINIEQGTKQICYLATDGSPVRVITKGLHDYVSLVVRGNTLIAGKQSMSAPTELYRVDKTTGKDAKLTSVNEDLWSSTKRAEVRKRMVKTTDGKEMLVWMILPPDFDPKKKYPTLLYCQGGPQSPVSQFFSYRWNFQLMANNGYIIVAPCRRGMPGFGQAWNDDISKNWGGQVMQDLLSAIDDASKETFVDKDKLGAIGASFGGYSTFWLAGNHNKRFKTFITHAGIFNFESMYGTTEEMWFENWEKGGAYWEEPKPKAYSASPHLFVKNWDTPMLVIHGEKDFRVPISEGIQGFQALQLKGIPSRFLYLPDEGHHVLQPQTSVLWNRVFFEWLDKYLK
jgi:dipeptidyl aminopeptidase/acylaminoacyl peptidase